MIRNNGEYKDMMFSIITCTYMSKRFVSKNISSVSSQSYRDYEHIFIDSYSTDGTVELIKEYQEKYPDNVKFYQVPRAGISNAMNEGIKNANGDFLIHLHSDDSFYDNNVLKDVAEFLKANTQLDWIYGKANIVEVDGRSVGIFPAKKILHNDYKSHLGRYLLKFFNYIPHQAVFIRKSVFERFGFFDETISSKMDPDVWLRIRDKTKWSYFDRIICNFMIRSDAQSSGLARKEEGLKQYELVQKRHLNFVEVCIAKACNTIIKHYNKSYR